MGSVAKKSLRLAALLSMVASVVSAAEKPNHLFILSGQSNMERLDPNDSFTPSLVAEFGEGNVTVVKDAKGGQPIRRWYRKWQPTRGDGPESTGDLYDRLIHKVNEASEGKTFSTVTFVWMQGERDAREKHGEVYADSLRGLLSQLAEDLGREDLNFVIGRLSDFDMANEKYPHWTMVREAQVEVAEADPRSAWVDTDDLNDGINEEGKFVRNDLHYSVDGYKEFGKRLAEASILLINQQGNAF